MNSYQDALDKMALAVESAKVAKSMVVQTEGINEEININLLAWRDDELIAVAQLMSEFMEDRDDRFERIIHAACVFRQGWGATSITMIAEAYCSSNPSATRGRDMAEVFASPDADYVRECLSFTHIEDETALFVAVPYSCTPPRKVIYDDPLQHRGSGVIRDARYPLGFMRALALRTECNEVTDDPYFYELLAKGIMDLGFEINYR